MSVDCHRNTGALSLEISCYFCYLVFSVFHGTFLIKRWDKEAIIKVISSAFHKFAAPPKTFQSLALFLIFSLMQPRPFHSKLCSSTIFTFFCRKIIQQFLRWSFSQVCQKIFMNQRKLYRKPLQMKFIYIYFMFNYFKRVKSTCKGNFCF